MFKKYIKLFVFITILMHYNLYPDTVGIGKVINKKGTVKKSNLTCNDTNCNKNSTVIFPGDRITTGKDSSVDVILNDGTSIKVMERSDIIIYNVISKDKETATGIFSDYGKFKIIQQNDYLETSLIFKTRTSIIKSVCSSMSVITANSETGLFVYNGEAGFASIDPSIIKAYIVKSGHESFNRKKRAPFNPEPVPPSLRLSWLQRHILAENLDRIIRHDKKGSVVEWFFIEKK